MIDNKSKRTNTEISLKETQFWSNFTDTNNGLGEQKRVTNDYCLTYEYEVVNVDNLFAIIATEQIVKNIFGSFIRIVISVRQL